LLQNNNFNKSNIMKNKKGNIAVIAIIIVIVAITASAITWIVLTKTQAPTIQPIVQPTTLDKFAGWQKYADTQHGFEFRYPPDWSIKKGSSASIGGEPVDTFWTSATSKDEKETFTVSVSDKAPQGYIYEGQKRSVTISGAAYTAYLFPNGYECYGDNVQPGQCKQLFIPVEKNKRWFVFGGGGAYTDLLSPQFLEILSTLKFTN
jgi:hypothetical protein